MANSKFKVGSDVIYGRNGICLIDDIKQIQFSKDTNKQLYYILKPHNDMDATFYIPAESTTLFDKMRPVMSRMEIEQLLLGVADHSMKWIADKSQRKIDFEEILRGGIGRNLFWMIRCIYLRRQELQETGKKLPSSDESILKSAEKLVREEFSYSLSIAQEEVGAYICGKLNTEDYAIAAGR